MYPVFFNTIGKTRFGNPLRNSTLIKYPRTRYQKRFASKKSKAKFNKRANQNAGMSFELIPVSHPTTDIEKPAIFIRDTLSGERQLVGSVPEGLQRKCNEFGFKTSKLQNIFLTGTLDWNSISGLPGLILTVSDQGLKKLGIYHCGRNILQYLISCWRFFVFRFGLKLDAREIDSGELIHAEKFDIKSVSIDSSKLIDSPRDDTSLSTKLGILVKQIFPVEVDSNAAVKAITNLSLSTKVHKEAKSTCWILTGKPMRGKFDVRRAKELGCEIKHFKTLCSFNPVTLDNGTVIQPEQVLGSTRHFEPILFLEIPSEDYLHDAFTHDWNAELKSMGGSQYGAVYHFLGNSMDRPLDNPEYVKFIQSFGKTTVHFISHRQYVPDTINYETSYNTSLKWKSLMPTWFPLFRWNNKPELELPSALAEMGTVHPMISGQVVNLKAGKPVQIVKNSINGIQRDRKYYEQIYNTEVAPLHMNSVSSKDEFLDFVDRSRDPKSILPTIPSNNESLKDQVTTVVLGTGSALPSKFRNVLSNMVRIPYRDPKTNTLEFRTVLLDAGENTLGTIKRLFNKKEVDQLFSELSMIYLSHLHADHHMGIASIIKEWLSRPHTKPLYIITPWQYKLFLQELNGIENLGDTSMLRYLSCDQFNHNTKLTPEFSQVSMDDIDTKDILSVKTNPVAFTPQEGIASDLYEDLHICNFQTCYANHCEYAYSCAITFELEKGRSCFKIAYSGDSRPRYLFSKIGHNSDLLIHESTLEDDKFEDAISKRHSTTSEATRMAVLMEAKKAILTHFSQRYRSFTSSAKVYNLLANPVSNKVEEKVPTTPITNVISGKKSVIDDAIKDKPIELASKIFQFPLTESMKKNSKQIEIVFAFDNMYINYGDLGQQRKVIEMQGSKLEMLFKSENKYENDDYERTTSKKNKKRKMNE